MHKILLIEDDPDLASVICQTLENEGSMVDHCTDGESGLLCARTRTTTTTLRSSTACCR